MSPRPARAANGAPRARFLWSLLAVLPAVQGCGSGQVALPEPRPIVIYSGARLRLDEDRAKEINAWVDKQQRNMNDDPSFLVDSHMSVADDVYPWTDLRISNDTVSVAIDPRSRESELPQALYGYMHLMVRMGRQAEWLPEAPDAVGYELERAILSRVADAWLLGRTVFDTAPYAPLDELTYAKESGHLDAFIFTARPDEFATARAEWAREHPDASAAYVDWFRDTFNREPPGLRPG